MEKITHKVKRHRQFILYTAIGLSGVTLDVVLFFVLYNVFHVEKNLATFISLSVAITNNFIWNALLNFKVRDKLIRRFWRFYIVGLSGFFITALFFLVMTDWLEISANITKLVSLLPILLLQYTINKLWSFKIYEEV